MIFWWRRKSKTQTYQEYARINGSYWISANNHANKINDSTLRKATIAQFGKIKATYEAKITAHEKLRDRIDEKTKELNDQIILVQLPISQKMIQNYQENELPDLDAMEVILGRYNKMIKETGIIRRLGNKSPNNNGFCILRMES